MAHTERRKTPRTPIHKLAYINFEPYNRGGVVTDISAAGLRFRTVEPLEQGGLLRLSIVLGAANLIEAVGELIWTDATHRTGGLRFAVLPAGAADQIRNWAEASNSANTSNSGVSPRTGASEAPSPNQASSLPEAASATEDGAAEKTFEPKLSDRPQATPMQGPGPEPSARSAWVRPSARPSAGAATPPRQPWVPRGAYQQPSSMPSITHFDPDPPARRSSFVRGMLGGIIVCAMLGTAAWFVLNNYVWQGSPTPSNRPVASTPLGTNPAVPPSPSAQPPTPLDAGNPPSAEQTPSAPAAQTLSPANPDVPPDLNTQANPGAPGLDDAALEAKPSANSEAPASAEIKTPQALSPQLASPGNTEKASLAAAALRDAKTRAEQPPQPSGAGESQLMLARQYLDGQGHPRNPTVASRLLWSAVEKGNSTAETTLADLYLRGDGVARNCAQARVLLSAASAKGNPEAMQKLQDLNRTGCR